MSQGLRAGILGWRSVLESNSCLIVCVGSLVFFRLFGDHSFLCLSIRKKAKNKTPQLPLDSCVARQNGRPSKLNLTAHTKRELLRDSDSRWPTSPISPALLGAADGDPEHPMSATLGDFKKRIWFLNHPNFYYVSLARIIPFHHAE